ncbi:MAG: hypothetical protein JW910_02615 [Anaerolineae bacterium]|nr:hypothetical protein [Anaerolineae bacterium]
MDRTRALRTTALTVGLLLAFWLTRLIALNAFPPFVDEAFHIGFAERAAQTGPLARAEEGRMLAIWLYAIVQAHVGASIWIARVATLLAVLPGVAAAIGIGRLAAGFWGAALTGLFYGFSTYHVFFERLALADPVSASAVMVGLYLVYRLSRRASQWDALGVGVALFVAVGAKVSALPYLGIPLAAALTLRPPDRPWREQLRWLAVAFGSGSGLTVAFLGLLYWRGYNPFFYLQTGPGGSALSTSQASGVVGKIVFSWDVLSGYYGPLIAVLLLLGVLVLIVRRRWFLPLCLIAPLLVLWLSSRQDSRHLIAPFSILLTMGAAALALELRQRSARVRQTGVGIAVVAGLLLWLPFQWTAWTDPLNLPLPAADYEEYLASEGSGAGLADVIDTLVPLAPVRVIGVLANCDALRYLALGTLPVECPRLNPTGEDIPALESLLVEARAPGVYVVLEDIAYAPAEAPGAVLAVFTRPGDAPALTLYDLAP